MSNKRKFIIKEFLRFLKKEDIVVFFGYELCCEAYAHNKSGYLYIKDEAVPLSLGMGLAIATAKRVFVFCRDIKMISDYSSILQIGLSGCNNLFIMVIGDGTHSEADGQYNIFNGIGNVTGLLFNSGVLVNNYTKNIEHNIFADFLSSYLPTIKGPLVAIMKVVCNKVDNNLEIDEKDMIKNFIDFVKTSSKE